MNIMNNFVNLFNNLDEIDRFLQENLLLKITQEEKKKILVVLL